MSLSLRLSAGRPAWPLSGPCPIIKCTALFFHAFSHTQTGTHTLTLFLEDMTFPGKWRLSFLCGISIEINSGRRLLFRHLCHSDDFPPFWITLIETSGSLWALGRDSQHVKKFKAACWALPHTMQSWDVVPLAVRTANMSLIFGALACY